MTIYRDVITGDEMLSDTFKMRLRYDGILYEVEGYFKRVHEYLTRVYPDRVDIFMKDVQFAYGEILDMFKDLQFFIGESKNKEGMVALLNYREDGTTPYMLFFKDGLEEEEV
ncbi:translationally-controlled tumor protein homolog [Branchiostoma lanceolatum]|uniref:translationally-controlled tumor protein homolog n=1 Tax=Branchiostoma lanceolatum TaxID=7740 RepID=UPI0034555298